MTNNGLRPKDHVKGYLKRNKHEKIKKHKQKMHASQTTTIEGKNQILMGQINLILAGKDR